MNETTITESVNITQTTREDGGVALSIHLGGAHELLDPSNPSSIAYMLSVAIYQLFNDGVVFDKANALFGLNLAGVAKRVE